MVPPRIFLTFKNHIFGVRTNGLVFADDIVREVKKYFSGSLRNFDISYITLHTTEDAEPLVPDSRLTEHAAELSRAVKETPLIVKVKSTIKQDLVRFWKALPEATLVTHGEMEYLQLKESYVLGDKDLGDRFLVRPIYKELCERFEHQSYDKWVVAGSSGIGKTVFAAYYMWIAACKNKTVVWEPLELGMNTTRMYLMTSGDIELVDTGSPELIHALSDSETVYIVDGQAPLHRNAWTLLVTSPECEHYRRLLKRRSSCLLYMTPWTYEEIQICKAILYPDEGILPTTLMDRLFEWYGGVPRYVLEHAAFRFKVQGRDEEKVLQKLVNDMRISSHQFRVMDIIKSHQMGTREAGYSDHLIHVCRHPSGDLSQFRLAWASPRVESLMVSGITQDLRINLQHSHHTDTPVLALGPAQASVHEEGEEEEAALPPNVSE